jgi:hypothetical protein
MSARLVIEFDDFERLKEHFSAGASVVELLAPETSISVPLHPSIPVAEFMWTRSASWQSITVLEPDVEGLKVRAPFEIPDLRPLDVVGGDVFEDTMSFHAAGDLSPLPCPVCSTLGVHLLSAVDAEAAVRRHAERVMGTVSNRSSDRKGIRWQVDGEDLDAFRCPNCLSLLVNGPSDPSGIWVVELEDA